MIESPPKITTKLISSSVAKMNKPEVDSALTEINQKYLYWSDVKYKRVESLTDQELWTIVKMSRMGLYSYKWPEYGIKVPVSNHMQELCHYFDMYFGGVWGTDSILPKEDRDTFLTSSIMEEAIASSQIEGASTTRKVAKDMLKRNISPRNRAEQMIHNNYSAIRYISENKNSELSPEFILRLHEIMTENTLDDPKDAGRFRTDNEVSVMDNITREIVHIPPDYSEIPGFIDSLCDFANKEGSFFIHPIIKAITIHFLVAYYHPFSDGNGRTARALFYWFMLKSGYWLMEYLSISRIISRAKSSYEKSFLYAEQDGNDIGYFITYNLRVLKLSFDELKNYIERKISQKQQTFNILSLGGLNYRQASILAMFRENASLVLSVNDLVAKFKVSKPTVYSDINPLIDRKLLDRIAINNKQSDFVKGPKYDEIVEKMANA